jgi:putative glycosyltransferase (TIGR04372 family)
MHRYTYSMSFRRILLFLNFFWAIPAIYFLRILNSIKTVEFYTFRADRIGHFIADTGEQLAQKEILGKKFIRIFFIEDSCNRQWSKMVRRTNLFVLPSCLNQIRSWNRKIPGNRIIEKSITATNSRDVYGLYQNFSCSIPFNKKEEKFARDWLISKGWQPGEPFVCLLVRDSKFLDEFNIATKNYWDYHSYRNSDIQSYESAIDWLSQNGVWVFRMGKAMERKLSIKHCNVVDYAFDDTKSDFLDIWLFANATAVISTSTGLDLIPTLYRKPQLFLNAMPLTIMETFGRSTWVPKFMFWKHSGKHLTLREMLKYSFFQSSKYEENGISLRDLDSDLVLQTVIDFWTNISRPELRESTTNEKQLKFWKIFKATDSFSELHGYVHPDFRVGDYWLDTRDTDFFD